MPGIVLLLLQKPGDELCPSWGCALRKSRMSETTCGKWTDSEGNENTWNQWLHFKEETVENRWDKAGHCSIETTGFCYRVPCRDNPGVLLKEASWFHSVITPQMLQSSFDVSAISINIQLLKEWFPLLFHLFTEWGHVGQTSRIWVKTVSGGLLTPSLINATLDGKRL